MSFEDLPPVLLLDLDDTIVTFSAGPRDFWVEAFERHAHELPSVSTEAFRVAIYHSSDEYWGDGERAARGRQDLFASRREVAAGAFARLGTDAGAVGDAIADHYTRTKEDAVSLFPGAKETLQAFRERGIRLGMITNGGSDFQRAKIDRYELAPFFDAIFVEGEFGVGKPHASVFEAALEALNARPEDAWMIGDNLHADIAGAQAVGIPGVWHDYSRAGLPDDPPAVPSRIMHDWSVFGLLQGPDA